MKNSNAWRGLAATLALSTLAACAPASASRAAASVPQPPAPTPASLPPGPQPVGRAADVLFMQHMMHHHAQALVMTALVPGSTTRDDLRRMARRIDISQRDEMELMQAWLAARGGAPVTTAHDGHAQHAAGSAATMDAAMPGMLSPAQLDRLRAARGTEFERLFLEGMIQHHEGAVQMVAALFRSPGAGQDAELFRFASDVDSDQRAEIGRMREMLAAMKR